MHTKKGFELRNICGESVVIAEGKENIDFNNIIEMNKTSAYLWKSVEGRDFSSENLARLLTDNYEVDYATAFHDAEEIAQKWIKAGIAEK